MNLFVFESLSSCLWYIALFCGEIVRPYLRPTLNRPLYERLWPEHHHPGHTEDPRSAYITGPAAISGWNLAGFSLFLLIKLVTYLLLAIIYYQINIYNLLSRITFTQSSSNSIRGLWTIAIPAAANPYKAITQ